MCPQHIFLQTDFLRHSYSLHGFFVNCWLLLIRQTFFRQTDICDYFAKLFSHQTFVLYGISPLGIQAPTKSLSVSLSETRNLLSELSEFLNQPKAPVKAKGKKSTARVLTSAESLSLLIEKEKKRKEEEEGKAKRKEERERKRKEKEAEKNRKPEIKKKKEEIAAKKPSKTKRSNAKKTPIVPDPPTDSDSQESADEDGVQSREISNNECAVCFSLYQDDLSSTGKLLTEWVECANEGCKKWMHIQCLQLRDGLYACVLCGAQFS